MYIGDNTEDDYEKNKAYGLKLTQDDQFPIVVTGLKNSLQKKTKLNKDLSILI